MSYPLDFTEKVLEDIESHRKYSNKPVINKLLILLEELTEHP